MIVWGVKSMSEMPEFVRKAIAAQGKIDPDEVLERMDEEPVETLTGVVEPVEGQETLELGSIEPDDHA